MDDAGLDRHDWAELDGLVTRMLEESGYDPTDPVVGEGEEREVVAEYLAAHELMQAAERDAEELPPGDVAAAINGYRAVFDHVLTTRVSAAGALEEAEAEAGGP